MFCVLCFVLRSVTSEFINSVNVEELADGAVADGLVEEWIDEVDAWLHGEHHALLQLSHRAQRSIEVKKQKRKKRKEEREEREKRERER